MPARSLRSRSRGRGWPRNSCLQRLGLRDPDDDFAEVRARRHVIEGGFDLVEAEHDTAPDTRGPARP